MKYSVGYLNDSCDCSEPRSACFDGIIEDIGGCDGKFVLVYRVEYHDCATPEPRYLSIAPSAIDHLRQGRSNLALPLSPL